MFAVGVIPFSDSGTFTFFLIVSKIESSGVNASFALAFPAWWRAAGIEGIDGFSQFAFAANFGYVK